MNETSMERSRLLELIQSSLAEIVDDPALQLTEDSTAEDVPDWDSINHVKLIIVLEGELDIHFDVDEINQIQDVRQLIDVIEKRRR